MVVDQSKARAMLDEEATTSGEEFEEGRVGASGLFSAMKLWRSNSSDKLSPRGSLLPSDHDSLWALMSPTMTVSSLRRGRREAENVGVQDD